MVAFDVLTVRAFGQQYPPNPLYPQLPEHEGQIVALEPGDGSTALSFTSGYAVVHDLQGHHPRTVVGTHGKTDGCVTDCRVAVSCAKFTRGSTWIAFGWLVPIAAIAMLVSALRARHRRKGKLMIGHLRYEWISRIGIGPGKSVRLEYITNGKRSELALNIHGGISVTVAQEIARRVAAFRLKYHPELTLEQREVLERLAEAQPLQEIPRQGARYYDLPGAVMVQVK